MHELMPQRRHLADLLHTAMADGEALTLAQGWSRVHAVDRTAHRSTFHRVWAQLVADGVLTCPDSRRHIASRCTWTAVSE